MIRGANHSGNPNLPRGSPRGQSRFFGLHTDNRARSRLDALADNGALWGTPSVAFRERPRTHSLFERNATEGVPYYGWYYRSRDPNWLANVRGWHEYYRAHADQRPPRDFASQLALSGQAATRADRQFLAIAQPLEQWRENPKAPVRLAAVSPSDRTRIETTARQL
jgi:hypothetical protein